MKEKNRKFSSLPSSSRLPGIAHNIRHRVWRYRNITPLCDSATSGGRSCGKQEGGFKKHLSFASQKQNPWRFPIHHHSSRILSGEFRQPPAKLVDDFLRSYQQDRYRRAKGIGSRHFYGGGRTCAAHNRPKQ